MASRHHSFQYRELIPRLADRYRVIAPDLPGFGFTEVSQERHYKYSFDALARTVLAFTDALGIKHYALYVFDYGAPTGFRLAMERPERVTAIVSQNGNAYEEGLGDAWAPTGANHLPRIVAVIARAQRIVSYGLTFTLKHILIGQHDLALSLHNTAKSGNHILDEHLATVCLPRNEKICAINTYLSDVEMVNAFFV